MGQLHTTIWSAPKGRQQCSQAQCNSRCLSPHLRLCKSAVLNSLGTPPPWQAERDVYRHWRSHRLVPLSVRQTGQVTADGSEEPVKSLQVLWQGWRLSLAEHALCKLQSQATLCSG